MNSEFSNANSNNLSPTDNMEQPTRNRRPSMLEEAEAFSNTSSQRTSTSNDGGFLHEGHASVHKPSVVTSNTTEHSDEKHMRAAPEPEPRRLSGQFSAPMQHGLNHPRAQKGTKMESWKTNVMGNLHLK